MKHRTSAVCAQALLALALAACRSDRQKTRPGEPADAGLATSSANDAGTPRVARATAHPSSGDCAGCHAGEAKAWSSSHHALASGTELHPERFDGRELTFGALRVTPRLASGKPGFRIQDGAGDRSWEVTGTIGVEPLQQYLLSDRRGRVLVAPVAWDTAAGRWFDPAPSGVVADPKDRLYWAGMVGNWNHLCGECHTTGFQKAFQTSTESYASRHTHPVVACEACHGSGAQVASLREPAAQLRSCMPCHSRRETLAYGATPGSELLDSYRPALLGHVVFEPDGRNFAPEEPFEWGAFSQSVMHGAGVRCSDCHDPHTARPRAEGDALCVRCHGDVSARHPRAAEVSGCVRCHMPTRAYMKIHQRHDHGMHAPGATRLGPTWVAAFARDPSVAPALRSLSQDRKRSSFVRASAIAALRGQAPAGAEELSALLGDDDALVRLEATETLAAWGRVPLSSLSDPARAVRFAALRGVVMGGAPPSTRTEAFERVRQEFEATAETHGDLASTWQNLGAVREVLGDRAGAVSAYEAALRLEPSDEWLAGRVKLLRGPPARR